MSKVSPSSFIAFGGDPARQSQLLARFRAHAVAGDIDFSPGPYDGKKGRPTACIVDSVDFDDFARETGFPASLGPLLDETSRFILTGKGEDENILLQAFIEDWLKAATPGADLAAVPSQIVIDVLGEQHEKMSPSDQVDDLSSLIRRVLDLHRAFQRGAAPGPDAWRDVRKAAVAATDRAVHREQKLLSTAIEDVCWDPATSRSFLVDLSRTAANLVQQQAIAATGWTQDDRIASDTAFATIAASQKSKIDAGEHVDFPVMFRAGYPELAQRFEHQLAVGNAAFIGYMVDFGRVAIRALSAAKAESV